jgi:hypothetical protein
MSLELKLGGDFRDSALYELILGYQNGEETNWGQRVSFFRDKRKKQGWTRGHKNESNFLIFMPPCPSLFSEQRERGM